MRGQRKPKFAAELHEAAHVAACQAQSGSSCAPSGSSYKPLQTHLGHAPKGPKYLAVGDLGFPYSGP